MKKIVTLLSVLLVALTMGVPTASARGINVSSFSGSSSTAVGSYVWTSQTTLATGSILRLGSSGVTSANYLAQSIGTAAGYNALVNTNGTSFGGANISVGFGWR